jgi:hypothetical protein
MKTEPASFVALRITEAPGLDPILVLFQDISPGQGRLIVECFGQAWSTYWGAMDDRTVKDFVRSCDTDYIANRLWPERQRRTKHEYAYLTRITEAVKAAVAL